jgi:endonuclease/exonuclease/phosphatase family metal-dependent hydrolase
LTKLVASYSFQAGLRLGLPFSNQAAKETRQKRPYTAHIVAGDFNASATELRDLGAERCGWEMVFGNLRTSSGGKAYDNFLINRDTKDHLMLSSHIYDLTRFANFAKGEQGISDHAPIVLSLHEQPPRP